MNIKSILNRFLGIFGLQVVRKSVTKSLEAAPLESPNTIVQCHSQDYLLQHQINSKWSLVDILESKQEPEVVMECPLCGYKAESEKFKKFISNCIFEGGRLIRHQCPECDLIYGPDKMLNLTDNELSTDYKWHYRAFSEGDSTVNEIRAFRALNPKKEGVYLNWGAGSWSNTINVLRSEGWNVYGYEPHELAASPSPYIITNQESLSQFKFDGIFSNNVLEHLRHPVQDLLQMRNLLKYEGKMSHATPCFEYLYEFTRFHLFFYLGKSRSILIHKSLMRTDDFIVDGDYMNIIISKV